MDFYRGKDIGGRDKLTETCLDMIRRGAHRQIHHLLPHISILRSSCFFKPLVELLKKGSQNQKVAAALALGSLGDERCVAPLKEIFHKTSLDETKDQSSQAAIIAALGETGSDASVGPLIDIFGLPGDGFDFPRKKKVLSALGKLAQQGSLKAQQELTKLLDNRRPDIRILAINELSVAFWHRPNAIPDTLVHRIFTLATQGPSEVRKAAATSLSNLAQLGCRLAQIYSAKTNENNA